MKTILKIDKRKKDSLEAQVIFGLKQYIVSPSLAPHSVLPQPKDIAAEYGIEPQIIQDFYDAQLRNGTIERTNDTYLKAYREVQLFESLSKQKSLQDFSAIIGIATKTERLSTEIVHEFDTLPFCPEVSPARYLKIRRLNYFEGHAEVMVIMYINIDILSEAEHLDFNSQSYYQLLKPHLDIFKNTTRYLSTCELPEDVYKTLSIPKSTPGMITYQYSTDAYGHLLLYYEVYSITETFYVQQQIPFSEFKKLI